MSARDLVEDFLAVDLRHLRRFAGDARSWRGSLHYGQAAVSAAFKIPDEGAGKLAVWWTYQGRSLEVRAALVATAQRLGGQRWWIVCPGCSRRCVALFVTGPGAACRRCLGLAYQSQRERGFSRACSAAHKLRERYGGTSSLTVPWQKPPRMHWRTWEKVGERERRYTDGVVDGAKALLARIQRTTRP